MLIFDMKFYGQTPNFEDIPKNILEQLEKMGVDDSSLLNHYESVYLNFIFEKTRNDFDFTNKRIGFITGSSGKNKSDKISYFKLEKDRYYRNYFPNGGTLYIFDEVQRRETNGYDAAIVYWCKYMVSIYDVIEKLK